MPWSSKKGKEFTVRGDAGGLQQHDPRHQCRTDGLGLAYAPEPLVAEHRARQAEGALSRPSFFSNIKLTLNRDANVRQPRG